MLIFTVNILLCSLNSKFVLTCSDHSVHDRKISVLGFCSLLQCPDKPAPVHNLASKVVPAIVAQLEGLIEAYKSKYKHMYIIW